MNLWVAGRRSLELRARALLGARLVQPLPTEADDLIGAEDGAVRVVGAKRGGLARGQAPRGLVG